MKTIEKYKPEINIVMTFVQILFMIWAVWLLWGVLDFRNGYNTGYDAATTACAQQQWRP